MAATAISALTSASALTGAEVLPVVQSSTTKGATVNQIRTHATAVFSTTTNGAFTQVARGLKVDITLVSVVGLVAGTTIVVNKTNAYVVCSISGSVATCISLGCLYDDPSGTTVASGSTVIAPRLSGLTSPCYSTASGIVLANWPIELFGMISTAQQTSATVVDNAGDVATGVKFVPRRIVDIIGVRVWTSGARTVKVSIWDPAGTRVASTSGASVAANTPTVVLFSSPYTVLNADIGGTFTASMYISSAAFYTSINTNIPQYWPNPIHGADVQLAETPGTFSSIWPARFWVAGDNRPTTSAAAERYLVEPVCAVRGT